MAQLKYLENGVWVAADTIPQSSDTNPGLIRVYNGLDQVETGFALDASQGKILQDQIDILSNDFIVEQGTEGIWTYRKWNSGIAECWGIVYSGSAAFTATGNVFYRQITDITFPTNLFNAAPYPIASPNFGNIGACQIGSVTKNGMAANVLSAVSQARAIYVYIHTIGTWK